MTAGGEEAAYAALSPVLQHHIANTLRWSGLRPLQSAAVGPVLRGDDALLLAPTAGGKTEAVLFPLLTRMTTLGWQATSVLYVCPLRALLNNLEPRVHGYASWLGRTAAVRHGDTTPGARRRQLYDRPDILLTTPESLESMLVSTLGNPRDLFSGVRAVVVDEVHAFAGDDRGWHLLGVLERLTHLAGQPLQRIGLSATVGNADELLGWLQGSNRRAGLPATVVAPQVSPVISADGRVDADVQLDYVGSNDNAATVIAGLHQGDKRLVFADSRRVVEELSLALRERGVETFLSHSSLSADERRRAEAAFAVGRDCVIVATSTLELGIDVGDLDRVVQIGAPSTVASLLQRLGRTGRREGTLRNLLVLATRDDELLRGAALLLLRSRGYVEPVVPPPNPRHIAAQQLLGLTLQERRVGSATWPSWFAGLDLVSAADQQQIADWLVHTGHLDHDGGMLFVGPEAERRYGGVHYRDLMAVFTADPQVRILHGNYEVGAVDPMLLLRKINGPRNITLAGRAWRVTHTDWKRHRAYVEPSADSGPVRWAGMPQVHSFALSDAIREVLLGADPEGVRLTRRAIQRLAYLREEYAHRVDVEGTVLAQEDRKQRWWTWAGARANAVLVAALVAVDPVLFDEETTFDNWQITLRPEATAAAITLALGKARARFGVGLEGALPDVDARALKELKFAEMLPPDLAVDTLAVRSADAPGAARAAARPVIPATPPRTP